MRLQASGELDAAFGDAGRTWLDFDSESGSPPTVHDMIVRGDGTVIAAGSSDYFGSPMPMPMRPLPCDCLATTAG